MTFCSISLQLASYEKKENPLFSKRKLSYTINYNERQQNDHIDKTENSKAQQICPY